MAEREKQDKVSVRDRDLFYVDGWVTPVTATVFAYFPSLLSPGVPYLYLSLFSHAVVSLTSVFYRLFFWCTPAALLLGCFFFCSILFCRVSLSCPLSLTYVSVILKYCPRVGRVRGSVPGVEAKTKEREREREDDFFVRFNPIYFGLSGRRV